jgi:hypothetical protein
MIRVTRDKGELWDVSFIGFNVWMYRPIEDEATVCGYQMSHEREAGIDCFSQRSPLWIPVAQAFENVCHDAKAQGISAIWINDPYRLFDVEPWVRQGLIDQF